MKRDLSRLLRPRSIAVVGGGAWCNSVVRQITKIGFDGPIWPVHPSAETIGDLPCFELIGDLPEAPDAVFVGVNRNTTVEVVAELSSRGAGGAVCFAAGFLEAVQEDDTGAELQKQLLVAAGEMPILGPNCYGYINYLDNACLWPDQHGGRSVDSGVAIITQSSNIAINLTMQQRSLPIAYVVTAGNQAQLGIAEIAQSLLDDPRVTALGLHIEGFGDIRAFEAMAAASGKPIVALKIGRSQQARAATLSHTASLAGEDAGADALLKRLGIARVDTLPAFLESLKLLHFAGRLPSTNIASVSCSGGEASLAADTAFGRNVSFLPLSEIQKERLRAALGPMVALANPLDYNTYIWNQPDKMAEAFAAIMDPGIALTMLIVDFPRNDRCDVMDWECVIKAAIAAKAATGANVAMVSSLPENLPQSVCDRLIEGGVVPMMGLDDALAAVEAASVGVLKTNQAILLPKPVENADIATEADAKALLASFGVPVPELRRVKTPQTAAEAAVEIGFPVVLKGEGFAHKTEAGAVMLNLQTAEDVVSAAQAMNADSFLIEQMVDNSVAELLVGVVCDQAHGYVLTLAAGGVLTELLHDSQSLLVPSSAEQIQKALRSLRIHKLLDGYRGKPGANISAIVDAVLALQEFVITHHDGLDEVEINPLICGPVRAVAVDVLLKSRREHD